MSLSNSLVVGTHAMIHRSCMLVVIDMQETFLGPRWRDQTIKGVVAAIARARAANQYVILVEMVGEGRSVREVLEALDGYNRVVLVTKKQANGSAEIIAECGKLNLAFDMFEMCGVYANACVICTIIGLDEKLKNRQFFVRKEAMDPAVLPAYSKLFPKGNVRLVTESPTTAPESASSTGVPQ